jgi:hypothetical protein
VIENVAKAECTCAECFCDVLCVCKKRLLIPCSNSNSPRNSHSILYTVFFPCLYHCHFSQYICPHNDHIRSVAALVACADNSRTATGCSSGMLSPNLRHTLMHTAAAGTSWRLRLLPSRTGPSSFWRCRAKPTTKLCIFYEINMSSVQG